MIYVETDFFLALLKERDWLKEAARQLLDKHKGQLWTSPITLIGLLLLSAEFQLDPERVLVSVLEIAELKGGEQGQFLAAANFVKDGRASVFDALHAAACGTGSAIISSDKVFDRLGLDRIRFEAC